MPEDFGDKTEAPTPRRLQEARDEGNIARSQDLCAAILLLGIMFMLKWFGPGLIKALKTILYQLLSNDSFRDLSTLSLSAALIQSTFMIAGAMAPFLIGVFLLAIFANIIQVGFHMSTQRLTPNLGALSPLKGLNRLFSQGTGLISLLMSIFKLIAVGAVAYSAIHSHLAEIVMAQQLSHMQIFALGAQVIYSIAIRVGVVLLILGIIDFAYQKYSHYQKLKMTKQEVKEEMRRMDGDPKIKQRRRQIAHQAMMQRLKQSVPTADVIVTNPTEFAVALKYDSNSMHAPRVVAKGQGYIAMRIREIAIANGIPILERKPLARALYKMVDIGQEIPEQFYSAVAEILAYVYELTGKLKRPSASSTERNAAPKLAASR